MILDPFFFFFFLYILFVTILSLPCVNDIMNLDTSEVWLPPHPSDFGLGDKKSHFWQNASVMDWSKEQVCIYLLVPKFINFFRLLYFIWVCNLKNRIRFVSGYQESVWNVMHHTFWKLELMVETFYGLNLVTSKLLVFVAKRNPI